MRRDEGKGKREEQRGRSFSNRSPAAGATGFALNLLLGVARLVGTVEPWRPSSAGRARRPLWCSPSPCLASVRRPSCSGILLPRTRAACCLAAALSGAWAFWQQARREIRSAVCRVLADPLWVGGRLMPTACSTVLLWFPDRRGLASGVLLAGVGLGLAFGVPVAAVIEARGGEAFVCLGIAFALALSGALLLKAPSSQSEGLHGKGALGLEGDWWSAF